MSENQTQKDNTINMSSAPQQQAGNKPEAKQEAKQPEKASAPESGSKTADTDANAKR